MGISMFSTHASPIAIDFGTSSVKLLQISGAERPNIVAAAELPIPDAMRFEPAQLLPYFAAKLPKLLHAGRFKGRRAVVAVRVAVAVGVARGEGGDHDRDRGYSVVSRTRLSP